MEEWRRWREETSWDIVEIERKKEYEKEEERVKTKKWCFKNTASIEKTLKVMARKIWKTEYLKIKK